MKYNHNNIPTLRLCRTLENMLKFTILSGLESCRRQHMLENGQRKTPAPIAFGYLLTTRQPYDDVPNPTLLWDNTSPSKLSTTYRLSSTPDQTPKSTYSGSLAIPQSMGMKRQISVQSRQLNSHKEQDNHSHQLPISRNKFNMLDYRNGNLSGRPTTVAPPTAALLKEWYYGFLPGNHQIFLKPTKQQPPPSINYIWNMATSDPTSHDYQITTPHDASILNHFKPPNTFYLVVLYIKQRGKELELEEKQHYKAYYLLQRVQQL